MKIDVGDRQPSFSRKQGGVSSVEAIYQGAASVPLNHLSVMGGVLMVVAVAMIIYKFRPPKKSKEGEEVK